MCQVSAAVADAPEIVQVTAVSAPFLRNVFPLENRPPNPRSKATVCVLIGENIGEQRSTVLRSKPLILLWSPNDWTMEILAERVGFEPTVQFPAHTLSKRAP